MSQNKNNPEDPIEELFQKKAGQFDIPYREEDWLKLEKRLDLADREKALERKRRWLIAASLLLFSLLGYFTYQNYSSINQINEQISEQAEQSESPAPLFPDLLALDDIPADENTGESPDVAEEEQEVPGDEVTDEENDQRSAGEDGSGLGNAAFTVSEQAGRELYVAEMACAGCGLTLSDDNIERSLPDKVESQKTATVRRPIASAYPEFEQHRSASASGSSPIAVGFVVSPDFSTSGSVSNFTDPGYKIGATVEYKFTENLSVSSGIIQSEVNYTARGDEYNPSGDYWSNGILPDETVAQCIVLDIPITFKYNVLNFERSRVFTSAGLSSYIMLNEEYSFSYEQNNSGYPKNWSERTGTGHLFSNAGFSVGFEYDIHSEWSLRAEPFVRIPLKGVGEGNVDLYSLGSFVSLNYRL